MVRVIIKEVRPGMVLARSLFHPQAPETLLLAAGTTLDVPHIARLHECGVYNLWVDYPGFDFIEDLFSTEMTTPQRRLCEAIRLAFHAQARRTHPRLPMSQYRHVLRELLETLLVHAPHMKFLNDLSTQDDVLLRHSAEVCYLGVLIGLKLDGYLITQRPHLPSRHARDVVNLGLGCLLHDIGATQLPQTLHESHCDPACADERWKRHVHLGFAMVRDQVEPSAAAVVLHHHQRFDGGGFPALGSTACPQAPRGTQIHIFARIATAADCFAHLVEHGGLQWPAIRALWTLQQPPCRGGLDPTVLDALLALVPPFLPGMAVKLNDQRDALVTQIDPAVPCYPRVQILQALDPQGRPGSAIEQLDLAESSCGRFIQSVDGFDVSGYMYGPRRRNHAAPASSALAACA